MGYSLIIVLFLALAFIGKGVVGFGLVLPFMLTLVFSFSDRFGLAFGFFSGIALSILNGTLLGRESLGLVAAMGMLYVFSERFSKTHIGYLILFSILGSVLYTVILGYKLSMITVLRDVILFFIFLPITARIQSKYFSDSLSLKL